jgi:hypothetical protein
MAGVELGVSQLQLLDVVTLSVRNPLRGGEYVCIGRKAARSTAGCAAFDVADGRFAKSGWFEMSGTGTMEWRYGTVRENVSVALIPARDRLGVALRRRPVRRAAFARPAARHASTAP